MAGTVCSTSLDTHVRKFYIAALLDKDVKDVRIFPQVHSSKRYKPSSKCCYMMGEQLRFLRTSSGEAHRVCASLMRQLSWEHLKLVSLKLFEVTSASSNKGVELSLKRSHNLLTVGTLCGTIPFEILAALHRSPKNVKTLNQYLIASAVIDTSYS